jgi:lysozyme
MQISRKGLELLKRHEGLRLAAYLCPANVWTIGYGSTGPHVFKGKTISQTEAELLLRKDLSRFEDGVKRLVKVPLTQGQFDALVSFSFNVGLGNGQPGKGLAGSTLLKKLNAGRYDDVPAELMKWTRGGGKVLPGLVKRRRDEAALWRGVGDADVAGRADGPVEPPKPPKTMAQSKTGNTAVGGVVAGGLIVATQAQQGAEAAKGISEAIGVPVLILIGLAIIAGAVFVWWDRRRKLTEEGV